MKLTKHAWIIWCIALIVIVALMILIPFTRTTAWWIVAACTVLMFGLCAFAFVRAFRKDNLLESKVLGWSIFKVGYAALIAQIIVGGILMGIAAFCPTWAAIIPELIVFAVTGICLTVKDAARETVQHAETAVTDKTAGWKVIRARATAITAAIANPELKKLVEEIRYADPTPTSMDGQIAEMLEALSSYADAANIKKTFALLNERRELSKVDKVK